MNTSIHPTCREGAWPCDGLLEMESMGGHRVRLGPLSSRKLHSRALNTYPSVVLMALELHKARWQFWLVFVLLGMGYGSEASKSGSSHYRVEPSSVQRSERVRPGARDR